MNPGLQNNNAITQSGSQGGSGVPPLKERRVIAPTQAFQPSSGETPLPPFARNRNWHRQFLAVDFRHAFWPWAVYIAALLAYYFYLMQPLKSENHNMQIWLVTALITLSAAGVIVRIFCADFADGTAERLLCNPVNRFDIWNLRLLLCLILIFVPAVLSHIVIPNVTPPPYLTTDIINLVHERSALVVFAVWCIWSIGPMWSLVLRRPILAYAPIVLAPFSVLLVAALINEFNPPNYGVIAVLLGITAQILAAILWRRLEVRQ